jgi:hypothetical protein
MGRPLLLPLMILIAGQAGLIGGPIAGPFAVSTIVTASGGGEGDRKAPRTPWGHPDLQGIWDGSSITPLERPEKYADREFLNDEEVAALEAAAVANPGRNARLSNAFEDLAGAYNDVFTHRRTNYARTKRTALIIDPPDGRIPPLTPEALAAREQTAARRTAGPAGKQRSTISDEARNVSFGVDADEAAVQARTGTYDGPEDRRNDRCLGIAIPATSPLRVVQSEHAVSIYYEYAIGGGAYRSIALDGRPHPPSSLRQKLGHSVGRWEGDTLVVDTTNFSGEGRYQGSDRNLHLIEKFRRVADDMLLYTITVDDPTVFTRPWTQEVPLNLLSNKENQLYESACHEGNYSLTGILAGARALEKEGVLPKRRAASLR